MHRVVAYLAFVGIPLTLVGYPGLLAAQGQSQSKDAQSGLFIQSKTVIAPNGVPRQDDRTPTDGRTALSARVTVYTVTIDKMAFGPTPTDLRVGDTVQWVNHDIFEHTATAKDGQFDIDLPPGATKSVVLKEPGTIDFFCTFHPGMTGSLKVQPVF